MGATQFDELVNLWAGIREDRYSVFCLKPCRTAGEWTETEEMTVSLRKAKAWNARSFACRCLCPFLGSTALKQTTPKLCCYLAHGSGVWAQLSGFLLRDSRAGAVKGSWSWRHLNASLFQCVILGLGSLGWLKWLGTGQESLSTRLRSMTRVAPLCMGAQKSRTSHVMAGFPQREYSKGLKWKLWGFS